MTDCIVRINANNDGKINYEYNVPGVEEPKTGTADSKADLYQTVRKSLADNNQGDRTVLFYETEAKPALTVEPGSNPSTGEESGSTEQESSASGESTAPSTADDQTAPGSDLGTSTRRRK